MVKPKKKKSPKQGKKSSRIGLLIVLLILLLVVIYFITSISENSLKIETEKDKEKKKPLEKEIVVKTDKIASEEKYKTFEDSKIYAVILEAVESIDMSFKDIKYEDKNNECLVKISINKKNFTLNFVNMIIKGKIESSGGTVVDGLESSRYQIMNVLYPEDETKYSIKLFYDRKETSSFKNKLAVIVDDFGDFNNSLITEFCELDKNITFAIMPNTRYAEDIMNKASKYNHEIMIHMPMEPLKYPQNDPGKNAILVSLTDDEIKKRVRSYIKKLPLAAGTNNHMGSHATSDSRVMKAVLEVLKENNLYFIDSRTAGSTIAGKMAVKMDVPTADRNLFLDDPNSGMQVTKERLKTLKKRGEKYKNTIVITHCTSKKKLDQLKIFIREAKNIGYELVPVSTVVNSKFL